MPQFEETYGISPDQMTERERFIALYSAIYELKKDHKQAIEGVYERLDNTNGKVRKIPEIIECQKKHSLYFKIISMAGVPVGTALLIALIKIIFNL